MQYVFALVLLFICLYFFSNVASFISNPSLYHFASVFYFLCFAMLFCICRLSISIPFILRAHCNRLCGWLSGCGGLFVLLNMQTAPKGLFKQQKKNNQFGVSLWFHFTIYLLSLWNRLANHKPSHTEWERERITPWLCLDIFHHLFIYINVRAPF